MRSVLVSPSRMPERLFPLVEDLEHSVQWTDLANNIGDLERNYPRRRTARKNREYDNLERYTVRRRSMPEVQKADLVYVHRPQEENSPRIEATPSPLSPGRPESPKVKRITWKPRTEFERSYFGEDTLEDQPFCQNENQQMYLNDNQPIYQNENQPIYQNHQEIYPVDPFPHPQIYQNPIIFQDEKSQVRQEDCQPCPIEEDIDHQNPNQASKSQDLKGREEKESIDESRPVQIIRMPVEKLKNEKLSFRGSRERLHEIFEYNRYLRRQFFAEIPGSRSQRRSTISGKLVSPVRNQETSKHVGAGFGSTETLTSQSNQSADSSTNGRKSRADFSNTPDSVDDDKPFINILGENEIQFRSFKGTNLGRQTDQTHVEKAKNERNDAINKSQVDDKKKSLPKVYFGMETQPYESEGLKLLDRFQNRIEDNKRSSFETDKSNRMGWDGHCRYQIEEHFQHKKFPSKFHQSLPNLPGLDQPDSISRGSVNGSTQDIPLVDHEISKLLVNAEGDFSSSAYTYKPLPTNPAPEEADDSKFYASYVHISDSSDSKSSTPSSIRKRKKNVPPPLDLSTVNERYERYDELERNFMPTYTVDVTKVSKGVVTLVKDINCSDSEIRNKDLIRSNELMRNNSNLEYISSNLSRSSSFLPKNCGESERDKEVLGTKNLNKSCCDLSNSGDLLSPQLVNNFKNSLADLSRCTTPPSVIHFNPNFERSDSILNSDCSPRWDQRNQISKHSSGTRTTLPSIYGPLPYSQYCDMKMSNLSIFLILSFVCCIVFRRTDERFKIFLGFEFSTNVGKTCLFF